MSDLPGARPRPRVRRPAAVVAGLISLGMVAAGCTSATRDDAAPRSQSQSQSSEDASASPRARSIATVATNLKRPQHVKVDTVLSLQAKDGTFKGVTVRSPKKAVAGSLSADKGTWTAKDRLEPGTRYRVTSVVVDDDGRTVTKRSAFRTQDLSLDQQTYPSFAPTSGSTVGVGMPVIVRFDVPVHNKAAIQKHLQVTNSSGQKGAWHWISDSEVHWRPVHYWKPGTDVKVTADINSVSAGKGIYGQLSRTSTFHVGQSVISKVNMQTHRMRVFVNGKLARNIPITTGQPGFTTRSGIKVIVEKFRHKRMDSETIGISHDDPNGYDLDDVEYAMRVTYSGEFVHAAPWSVGSQGYANVSHGCTGMSTSNAGWLYGISKPGDVVDYTGTNRQMEFTNGYGDWNEPFSQYKQGSALG
jgi:lipoprotein-anchoring transpeptidase ErfK/SrfK